MENRTTVLCLSVLVCAAALVCSEVPGQEKPPSDLPDITESAKLPDKMPKTVGGIVTLSGKGVGGVRVTDGVHFVTTGEDGRYSITLKPDPLIPYLPSRTIAVSWPSGTWPVHDEKTGRYRWWARLKDVQDAQNVNFELVPREVVLPMCVGFGTDPHDMMRSPGDMVFNSDIANAPGHVAFSVIGGDVGYASFGTSEELFTSTEEYTKKFPVMLLHVIGNHDMVGKHIPWTNAPQDMIYKHTSWFGAPHELAGYGGFTKHLNPTHWSFDCAGVRFMGVDYSVLNAAGAVKHGVSDSALDWMEEDLKSKPKDTPVYFFNHQPWSPTQRFFDVCSKYGVRLCLGGDTHRNMFLYHGVPAPGEPQYWTKMGFYTLVYIDKAGFEFVDVCISHGARNGWDGAWNHDMRGCPLYTDPAESAQRGEHAGLKDITLNAKSQEIQGVKGDTYDLRFGARGVGGKPAKRWGLRLTGADGKAQEFVYDAKDRMLTLMGLRTPFNPAIPAGFGGNPDPKEQEWVEMRIKVMPDRVRVIVNSRIHYQKYITPGAAKKIEFFAEDGAAEFGVVDVWQHAWPKDWKPRPCANTG